MRRNTDNYMMTAIGPAAAVLLGMALFPLRGATAAANFTFLFLVLTILVAEYGGRRAAFATALCSALSLDYFFTEPYQHLAIKSIHDIIAFAGLALCGFLVATFSSQRSDKISGLDCALRQLDLLHSAVSSLTDSAHNSDIQLHKLLDMASSCAPLAAAVIRDENNKTLAARAREILPEELPSLTLSPYTLLPKGADVECLVDSPFPKEGARIPLLRDNLQVGWLDLWGNEAPMTAEVRRTLSDVAFLLGRMLAGRGKVATSMRPA